jgi:hypothetical protein
MILIHSISRRQKEQELRGYQKLLGWFVDCRTCPYFKVALVELEVKGGLGMFVRFRRNVRRLP